LVNDVPPKQVEGGVEVAEAFAVDEPILALSAMSLRLVKKPPEVLARCFPISRLVSATDDDVQAGPTLLPKIVAPPCEKRVQLLELDAHSQFRGLKGARGQGPDIFMELLELHDAFLEYPVDECACAAQQLGGSPLWMSCRWCGGDAVRCGLCASNLCALYVKLVRGEFGYVAASVRHQRELDTEREVRERLELMVRGWYDLLALFPAVAQERRIVANHDNHGDALPELRQDLFDQSRIGLVKAEVNGGKCPVRRREFPRFGELALRVWIRELHRSGTGLAVLFSSKDIAILQCFKSNKRRPQKARKDLEEENKAACNISQVRGGY
jgi:hypothetical protein